MDRMVSEILNVCGEFISENIVEINLLSGASGHQKTLERPISQSVKAQICNKCLPRTAHSGKYTSRLTNLIPYISVRLFICLVFKESFSAS